MELGTALARIALLEEVTNRIETSFGTKYIIDGILTGPSGREASIRTIWIVERNGDTARFITAYPI